MTVDVSSDQLLDESFVLITEEHTKGYLEEEFELFEPALEEERKEFEEKRANAPAPSGPYEPENLNRIFLKKLTEKFPLQESYCDPNWSTLYYNILDNNGQKIILCCPAAEFKTEKDYELPDLNRLLFFLKERQIYSPDHILIIPITEPYRGFGQGHFRLLALVKDDISYFDSKNLGCQQLTRFFTPAKSAAYVSMERMKDAVGFIQQLSVVVQTAIDIPFRYHNYFDLVRKTCHEHFPDKPFSMHALAIQAWYDERECGEKTIETGIAIASGMRPGIAAKA